MKILHVFLENFASYKRLDFQFDGQGLSLIHGPTGAGKSTLCDAIPWVLFGVTAKGGKVDEVLSWPGNLVTRGELCLSTESEGPIYIIRTRGPKAKDNDLYWHKSPRAHTFAAAQANATPRRGKDIPDTQRLINQLLGMDADLYLSGAYYHEFSKTASFFTTTAKARRELAEQLVDLSLAKTLQIKASEAKKAADIQLQKTIRKLEITVNRIDLLTQRLQALKLQSEKYISDREAKIARLDAKVATFEADQEAKIKQERANLDAISTLVQDPKALKQHRDNLRVQIAGLSPETCVHCGASKHSHYKEELKDQLHKIEQEIIKNEGLLVKQANAKVNLKNLMAQTNTYAEQLVDLYDEVNPYVLEMEETMKSRAAYKAEVAAAEAESHDLTTQVDDYKLLTDIVNDFRAHLIESTVSDLEHQTNAILTKHFDAEIRIQFTTGDADKIEVSIQKDGNQAVYSQLSKGQRQLLRLAFGVSVMRVVANQHGLRFNVAMMDEAFDGLSEEFKVKAFDLLQELSMEYDSLFVVEHSSELKALFAKQFVVSLTADGSVVEEA